MPGVRWVPKIYMLMESNLCVDWGMQRSIPVYGWLLRQLDTSAKLERKAHRMSDFPFPEASTSAQPTAIISLKTHMISVNICWFLVIASITYVWRPYSHVFLKGQHFPFLVNFIWMVPLVHGMGRWIESCQTWVPFPWPLRLIWDKQSLAWALRWVLVPSSHFSRRKLSFLLDADHWKSIF